MKKVIVIGAGAAGLMAACAAADAGARVIVLEHNEKAGKKLFITGKGRCNYSNACENQDFFANVLRNPKFLYSAIYSFDSAAMTAFLQENGCPTKEERGKRLFPASDHAYDVTDALVRHLRRSGGELRFHKDVTEILVSDTQHVQGVMLSDGQRISADAVVVATGGRSYPSTGSAGAGYRLAEKLGLKVEKTKPSLVPLTVGEAWPMRLQGLALKNVAVSVESPSGKHRPIYQGFGELLFTHFGISGPLILSASCHMDFTQDHPWYLLHLDLKPALSREELEASLLRRASASPKRELRNVLKTFLPERLAEETARLYALKEGGPSAQAGENQPFCTLNDKQRSHLARLMKDIPITVTGTRGFAEAIVTRGGVSVKEINPSTMEAKRAAGVFFAGEILDVDAYTGGYNLQIAWSTGHLAGENAARCRENADERKEENH